jgi:hypothetical protein
VLKEAAFEREPLVEVTVPMFVFVAIVAAVPMV